MCPHRQQNKSALDLQLPVGRSAAFEVLRYCTLPYYDLVDHLYCVVVNCTLGFSGNPKEELSKHAYEFKNERAKRHKI